MEDISLAVSSIRFPAADVAVVDCNVLPSGSRATYVVVRRGDSWLVAAGRVLPPEERDEARMGYRQSVDLG